MSNPTNHTLQMLHVTADGAATAVRIPVRGPDALQQLVGGPIQGVRICGELAFYVSRSAVLDREPNPFVFDIISEFGEPNQMVFGDVVLFAGTDNHGNERTMSDDLVTVLVELVRSVAGRPESVSEIIGLSNDLRVLTLAG